MERIRVSDLAREMGLNPKDMELRIKDLNIFIDKGAIHENDALMIRQMIKGSDQAAQDMPRPSVKRKAAPVQNIKIVKVKTLHDTQEEKSQFHIKKVKTLDEIPKTVTPTHEEEKIKPVTAARSFTGPKIIERPSAAVTVAPPQEEIKVQKTEEPPKEAPIVEPAKETMVIIEQPKEKPVAVKEEIEIKTHLPDIEESPVKPQEEPLVKQPEKTVQPEEITEKKELKVVHFEKRQTNKPKEGYPERDRPKETPEVKKTFFTAKATDRRIQLNKPTPPPQQRPRHEGQDTRRTDDRPFQQQRQAPSDQKKFEQRPAGKFQKFPPRTFHDKKTATDFDKTRDFVPKDKDSSSGFNEFFPGKEPPIDIASTTAQTFKPKKIEKKKTSDIEEEKAKSKTPIPQKKASKKHIVKFISEELHSITDENIDVATGDVMPEENVVVKPSFQPRRKQNKFSAKQQDKKTQPIPQPPKQTKKKFTIYESIQVGELAKKMSVKAAEVVMKLMTLGVMATVNQTVDYDTASLVAAEFGFEVEKKLLAEDSFMLEEPIGGVEVLRPPVVTVMGHVDHGKTSLLDAIRHADVASGEAGGITQHIGAYHVKLPAGNEVVFLDTPGHEAFTQMRARGAKVTDIVLLVVAADDGVMAQTREAIDHARDANVPIIVAVNKIDKENANIDRVKKELSAIGLIPEDWGGDTIFVNISAKKRIGIEELIEMLSVQAEVLELKAVPERPAVGHVVEARLDKGRGPVATLLVSNGTLKMGDAVVCGVHYGKIRAMINDKGGSVTQAGPSMPVEVQGLSDVPEAGNEFFVLSDEKKSREISENRQRKLRETELAKTSKITLENMLESLKEQEVKELKIILKADVQGSTEALADSLVKLSTREIKVNVIRSGTGAIIESDVLLASASHAIIIGFNVKPTQSARALAETETIDIKFYDIIYNAIDDVKKAMLGLLEPVYEEKPLGRAEVRQVFSVPKIGSIAGCYMLDGMINRNAKIRLLRDSVVIYTGKVSSLRRFKDDVKEVQTGYECGIGLERFNDIKPGDIIEAYKVEEIAPTMEQLNITQSKN